MSDARDDQFANDANSKANSTNRDSASSEPLEDEFKSSETFDALESPELEEIFEAGFQSERELLKEFMGEFGDELGAQYFAAGLSLTQARSEFNRHLRAEQNRLQKLVKLTRMSETEPLSSGHDFTDRSPTDSESRNGFASRIKITKPKN